MNDQPPDAAATPWSADLDAAEAALGYRFRDRSLLLTALTHRSFAHESLGAACLDNEPLEFLGDTVLAFVLADHLYRAFPGLDEGRLTRHKHLLERATTLACIAADLGLGSLVRVGRGEQQAGGVQNDNILSDTFEAVLAAVYLDGGLDAARAFVRHALGERLSGLDRDNPIIDFKSALQELAQERGLGSPRYDLVAEEGPDHAKSFRVVVSVGGAVMGEGFGTPKRKAHQLAAQLALEKLRELD